jgi:hypothetical protein
MLSKISLLTFVLLISSVAHPVSQKSQELSDADIQHFLSTLPRLVPQLRNAGITVSEAYYIWPQDASLHAKGQILLEEYGYDALKLEALKIFCKTWFCLQYDSLLHERQRILMSNEAQLIENPYITDDQKRINIRILNKDLGHDKQKLKQTVGEKNIQIVKNYCEEIKKMWKKLGKPIEERP